MITHCLLLTSKNCQFQSVKMPMPSNMGAQQGPSCFDRVKLGFMMGMCIGMASGAIFGGFGGFRYGLRGKELVQQVQMLIFLFC